LRWSLPIVFMMFVSPHLLAAAEPSPTPLAYSSDVPNRARAGWFFSGGAVGATLLPGSFAVTGRIEYHLLDQFSLGFQALAGIADAQVLSTLLVTTRYDLPYPYAERLEHRLVPFLTVGLGTVLLQHDEVPGKDLRAGAALSPGLGSAFWLNDFFSLRADLQVHLFTRTHGERVFLVGTLGAGLLF